MASLVSHEWLLTHLSEENIRILDCRFWLGDPSKGAAVYRDDHIPGAVYMDLERDLSSPVAEHGGRHPLPSAAQAAEVFGRAGIDETVTVVVYDDQHGAMAARCWWLLRYFGHERVYVLDGNYSEWKKKGYPVTDTIPAVSPRRFQPQPDRSWLATVDEVRAAVRDRSAVLIDSREWKRYAGLEEPIDRRPGRIPGAVHRFWKDGVAEGGYWKSAADQAARFADLDREAPLIVYCGSGVTACPNVLALKEAGYRNVRLYVGSFSDWISYPDHPVETDDPSSSA
ncbi:sulfurtransferase [Geobacillus thermodenitrificans]|jgi:thiosulfate/3-mercaptopyruvate sulfurtransferase|uniref:sulfurtransferase n=1 Tax=Geobacillus thermodenitrificans TaxID=33940 RepID=UPI002E0000BF|nr:thiosulfate/3-mercaptopyruvate sulfurtransferase [Geobacillus thermodenitrificans]MED3904751.1 sulfurtransferase [Geobacillus thermodenitrificans]